MPITAAASSVQSPNAEKTVKPAIGDSCARLNFFAVENNKQSIPPQEKKEANPSVPAVKPCNAVILKNLQHQLDNLNALLCNRVIFLKRKEDEIQRYEALPDDKKEAYKTTSYNNQKTITLVGMKKCILELERDIEKCSKVIEEIRRMHDKPVDIVYEFIKPLIYNILPTECLSDSLVQLTFEMNRPKAANLIKFLLSEEKKDGFKSYFNRAKSYEAIAGLHLILGHYETAIDFMCLALGIPGLNAAEHQRMTLLFIKTIDLVKGDYYEFNDLASDLNETDNRDDSEHRRHLSV